MIADIHVHPTLKPYCSGYPHPNNNVNIFDNYDNPGVKSFLKKLNEKKHLGIVFYSQSNLQRLYDGGVRVICHSLYPLEKGFTEAKLSNAPLLLEIVLKVFGYTSEHLVEAVSGVGINKVRFIKDQEQDYFPDLQGEYDFLVAQSKLNVGGIKCCPVKNYAELTTAVAQDKTIAVIVTIEGAHTFGTGTPNTETFTIDELKQTLTKNIAASKAWTFPPFFVTLNHHFWNQLGGHARSLSGMLSKVVNQYRHLNEGLTEAGKHAVREFLSVKNGRRIYIDIKHMSARSRIDFYDLLDKEFKGQKIPVICSHTGISGSYEKLKRVVELQQDKDEDNDKTYLHNWSINLCREDVLKIYSSGGLIGLQLDEKRMGGGLAQALIGSARDKFINSGSVKGSSEEANYQEEYLKVLFANLFTAVKYIKQPNAWDILCLGSDMDGVINPMDIYPDSSYMKELEQDMIAFLYAKPHIKGEINLRPEFYKTYMYGLSPEEIVYKIMYGNVDAFLKKYF